MENIVFLFNQFLRLVFLLGPDHCAFERFTRDGRQIHFIQSSNLETADAEVKLLP